MLNDVLVSPSIIKDLISARRFARDNSCSVCLDPLALSADSLPSATSVQAFVASTTNTDLWHRRLGHLGHEALTRLAQASVIPPPKGVTSLCHACQLGRHTRLPFTSISLGLLPNLSLFIVICGPHLYQVCLVLNTIWSF